MTQFNFQTDAALANLNSRLYSLGGCFGQPSEKCGPRFDDHLRQASTTDDRRPEDSRPAATERTEAPEASSSRDDEAPGAETNESTDSAEATTEQQDSTDESAQAAEGAVILADAVPQLAVKEPAAEVATDVTAEITPEELVGESADGTAKEGSQAALKQQALIDDAGAAPADEATDVLPQEKVAPSVDQAAKGEGAKPTTSQEKPKHHAEDKLVAGQGKQDSEQRNAQANAAVVAADQTKTAAEPEVATDAALTAVAAETETKPGARPQAQAANAEAKQSANTEQGAQSATTTAQDSGDQPADDGADSHKSKSGDGAQKPGDKPLVPKAVQVAAAAAQAATADNAQQATSQEATARDSAAATETSKGNAATVASVTALATTNSADTIASTKAAGTEAGTEPISGPTGKSQSQQAEGGKEARAAQRSAGSLNSAETSRFVNRVAKAFEFAQDRGGVLKLRLSPPELGSMRLEITLKNGAVVARLETETAAAKTALMDNLGQLRERLAEQNIRIESFEVDVNDQPAFGQGTPEQRDSQAERSAVARTGANGQSANVAKETELEPPRRPISDAAGQLDLVA